ncbi:MAG: ABC transporter substrate-binding protein [Bdellovibrionota bacterium]
MATELIFGIENEIKDYNITRSVDKNAFALSELLTEGLFYLKPDASLEPDLVKKFKRVGRLWSFELRESVFSNGKKLSCEDVRANIEEARFSPRPVRARLGEISSVKCKGQTLLIETKEPFPQLLYRMGYIVRVYEATTLKDKAPIGSGPYVVRSKTDKDLVLVPNPHYSKKAHYERILFRALRDPWLRDLALLSGNVDFLMEGFSQLRLKAFESREGAVKIYRNPSQLLSYMVLKQEKFSLKQREYVREILYKEKAVEKFWGTQVESTTKIFRNSENALSLPQAITKIAPFSVEVSVVADETQINFLKFIAGVLKPYGVSLKMRPLEFVSFMKRLNAKNFDAYLFYVDTSHALNLGALLHSRGNRLDVSDSELDFAFASYATHENSVELRAILNNMERRIYEKAYLIPLYWSYKELICSKALGIEQSSDGFWRDLLRSHKYTKQE